VADHHPKIHFSGTTDTIKLHKKNFLPAISSVGIATRHGPDGPGIEFRCGFDIFITCPYWPWSPPSLLYNGYRVSFPELKRPGVALVIHPLLASRLKKEYSNTSNLAFM